MAAAKKTEKREPTLDEELSREERRDGDVEVDLSEADEAEDVEDVEPQPSRREKKQQRGKLREEADRLREENERLARERSEATARAAALEGYMQGMRQAQGGAGKDPIDEALDAVYKENEDLAALYDSMTPAMQKEKLPEMRERARKIKEKEAVLLYQKAARQNAPNQQQLAQHENSRLMEARYPDLIQNRTAMQWAIGRYQQLVAEGQPGGWETTDLVMNEARTRYSPGAKKPDPTMERRLASQSRGQASAGGGGERVILSTKDQEMADVMFDKEKDPRKRLKLYAEMITKKKSA